MYRNWKRMRKRAAGAGLLLALAGGVLPLAGGAGQPVCLAAAAKPDKDGYVARTEAVQPQKPVDLSQLKAVDVETADPQATPRTKALARYLRGIADSGMILYGHQNDMSRKVAKNIPTDSDTYDITGDYPAIIGMDGLALTGNELELTEGERKAGVTLPAKLAQIARRADRHGAIVTMSCHMPNFDRVAKRPKIDGSYDYCGYSPNITDGDVVRRILPGGDLNPVFTGYLDLIVDFDRRLQEDDIPLLFRPFHENTGSWFWWGAGHCTPQQFRQLFQYTEEYLQGKGLHNILYVYSPGGGETKSEGDYGLTYPGNRAVDICGLDMYHRDPERGDGFLQDEMDPALAIVERFAKAHHKTAALTEGGILCGNSALAKKHNKDKDWFREVMPFLIKHHMAWFMTWSNFDETNFDQPYMVDAARGHEMVNEFIAFYNEPASIFASQNPDYRNFH